MKPKDLRNFLASVAADPQLKIEEINRPVHKDYELSAIAKHAEASSNPAMIFRSVIGSEMPVVSGLYACRRRVALALGAATENVIKHYLNCLANPVPTVEVEEAPVKEVRISGDDIDLNRLPVLTNENGRFSHRSCGFRPLITVWLQVRVMPGTSLRSRREQGCRAEAQGAKAGRCARARARPTILLGTAAGFLSRVISPATAISARGERRRLVP